MRRAAIPALLTACAGLAAADPAPSASVAVVPESVRLSYQVQFDEQGRFRRTTGDLGIELGLKPAPGVQLLACRGIVLGEAVTDAGEVLRPRNRGGDLGQELFSEWERTNNNYDVGLSLAAPARPPQVIARVTGTIRLAVVAGTGSRSELRPFQDWLGKPLILEGMESPITVAVEEGRVTLRGSQEAIERLDKVSAQRADGREIAFNGWGSGSDGDEWYRSYQVQVPGDGALVILLLPPSTEIQVPFSLGPLPLVSGPAASATPAVRVPASQPRPPEGAKPKVAEPAQPNPPQGAGGF
jgi:hypothetical protein